MSLKYYKLVKDLQKHEENGIKYIEPNSSPKWQEEAKENLITFIMKRAQVVGLPAKLVPILLQHLKNNDWQRGLKVSEIYRNRNIQSNIEQHDREAGVFIVILGKNHIKHMMKLLKPKYNVIAFQGQKRGGRKRRRRTRKKRRKSRSRNKI